jgi:hypothetical protein
MEERPTIYDESHRRYWKNTETSCVAFYRVHFSVIQWRGRFSKARHSANFLNIWLESAFNADSKQIFFIFTKHFLDDEKWSDFCPRTFATPVMYGITNSFPGGIFPSVYYLSMLNVRPFEHDFFNLIAGAFPSLRELTVTNLIPQIHKQQHWQLDNHNNNQNSSIIIYPHLKTLFLPNVHIDYVEEFLHDNNTCLPSLIQLHIKYEQLETVTKNFRNKRTHRNCANLKSIYHEEATVYPKDFYLYFPSL